MNDCDKLTLLFHNDMQFDATYAWLPTCNMLCDFQEKVDYTSLALASASLLPVLFSSK
jgi:hypothetical protein